MEFTVSVVDELSLPLNDHSVLPPFNPDEKGNGDTDERDEDEGDEDEDGGQGRGPPAGSRDSATYDPRQFQFHPRPRGNSGASTSTAATGLNLRQFEEEVDKLRNENLSLRLRIYIMEEKYGLLGAPSSNEPDENVNRANIDLQMENHAMKQDLKEMRETLAKAHQMMEQKEEEARRIREQYEGPQVGERSKALIMEAFGADIDSAAENEKEKRRQAEVENNRLRSQILELEHEAKTKIPDLEHDLETKAERILQLEGELSEERERQRMSERESKGEREQFRARISELHHQVEAKSVHLETLESELVRIQNCLEEKEREFAEGEQREGKMQKELDDARFCLIGVKEAVEIRSREEERLKKEVEIRNQALEVLRAEYEVAKQTVKRYRSSSSTSKGEAAWRREGAAKAAAKYNLAVSAYENEVGAAWVAMRTRLEEFAQFLHRLLAIYDVNGVLDLSSQSAGVVEELQRTLNESRRLSQSLLSAGGGVDLNESLAIFLPKFTAPDLTSLIEPASAADCESANSPLEEDVLVKSREQLDGAVSAKEVNKDKRQRSLSRRRRTPNRAQKPSDHRDSDDAWSQPDRDASKRRMGLPMPMQQPSCCDCEQELSRTRAKVLHLQSRLASREDRDRTEISLAMRTAEALKADKDALEKRLKDIKTELDLNVASVRKELRRTAEEREEERKREREDREKFKEESDKERERLNEENAKEREKLESENVSVRIRLDSVQRRNEELELQLKKTAANEENGVNKENERSSSSSVRRRLPMMSAEEHEFTTTSTQEFDCSSCKSKISCLERLLEASEARVAAEEARKAKVVNAVRAELNKTKKDIRKTANMQQRI